MIPGAAIDGSMRSTDLHMKIEYLRQTHGHRVVTGATATPIANSITEVFVVLRYLRPDLLDAAKVDSFDGWAATFGDVVSDMEIGPTGGFQLKSRFARFKNVQELLRMFHVFADVKTAEDLKLPTPLLARRPGDGERSPETVVVEPSVELLTLMAELDQRADRLRSSFAGDNGDHLFKVLHDGRAAAVDLRLIGRDTEQGTKVQVAAERIAALWADHRNNIYPAADGTEHPTRGALQIVFCDLGTPKPRDDNQWTVYDELRTQVAARGVPRESVRFVHEAKNDQQKGELFAACRDGRVSVLVGSTPMMATGANVQLRAIALHHIDCPWKPAELHQRDGRIMRQGNKNDEIHILRYVTEGSFDAYSWQTVERKAAFISQVIRGRLDVREIEDIGDMALSASEVKALATGDTRMLERAKLQSDIARLDRLERAHHRNQTSLDHTITESERRAAAAAADANALRDVINASRDTSGDAFSMQIGTTRHTKRPDAGKQLLTRLIPELERIGKNSWTTVDLGEIATLGNVPITAAIGPYAGHPKVRLAVNGIARTATWFSPKEIQEADPTGLITRLENRLRGLEQVLNEANTDRDTAEKEASRAHDQLGNAFPQHDQLLELRTRLADIDGGIVDEVVTQASNGVPGNSTLQADTPAFVTERAGTDPAAEPPADDVEQSAFIERFHAVLTQKRNSEAAKPTVTEKPTRVETDARPTPTSSTSGPTMKS